VIGVLERWVYRRSQRAAGRVLADVQGHDVGLLPGGTLLHRQACWCGFGSTVLVGRRDRRELALHVERRSR